MRCRSKRGSRTRTAGSGQRTGEPAHRSAGSGGYGGVALVGLIVTSGEWWWSLSPEGGHGYSRIMPSQDELVALEGRRAELRDRYLQAPAERPTSTARGIHHAVLICSDVEQTIEF